MASVGARTSSDGGRRTRDHLIEATIDALAEVGFHAATLSEIANRTGVSPGLVAHHFANKDGLLAAAFRDLISRTGGAVLEGLRATDDPRARLKAIVDGHLAPEAFDQRIGAAWLAFWGNVPRDPRLRRLQTIYQRRMTSNLRDAVRSLAPRDKVASISAIIASMIDGVWLRAALSGWSETDSESSRALLMRFVDSELAASSHPALRTVRGSVPARSRHAAAVLQKVRTAQAAWAERLDRPTILRRAAELIRRRADQLAELETRDTGAPIQRSRTRMEAAAAALHYAAQVGEDVGEVGVSPPGLGYAWRAPVGLVAAQADGRRLVVVCRSSAVALARGNAMLLVASGSAQSADRLAGVLSDAGLPEGVLEIIDGETSDQCGTDLRWIGQDRGAGAPIILLDGRYAKRAALAALHAAAGDSGLGPVTVYAPRNIVSRVTQHLLTALQALRIGDPLDPATEMGPLTNGRQAFLDGLAQAKATGARVMGGGETVAMGALGGEFVRPVILEGTAQAAAMDATILVAGFDELEELTPPPCRSQAAFVYASDLALAQRLCGRLPADVALINPPGDLEAALDACWADPSLLAACTRRQRTIIVP